MASDPIARTGCRVVVRVSRVDADRAAMRGQFVHVEERQSAMRRRWLLDRGEGQVGVVLVVDGVPVAALDEVQQQRKLHGRRRRPARAVSLMPLTKSSRCRARERARCCRRSGRQGRATGEPLCAQSPDRRTRPAFRHALAMATSAAVFAVRLDAEDGDVPAATKVLEQVSVIAGDFDHPALVRQSESPDHHRDIVVSVAKPGVRVAGEVAVLVD